MDDFAVAPGVPNAFKLVGDKNNEVAPDKRPLSSMSPVIALEDGRPALVAGGSGGPTIISGVIQVMLNVLDFRSQSGARDRRAAHPSAGGTRSGVGRREHPGEDQDAS